MKDVALRLVASLAVALLTSCGSSSQSEPARVTTEPETLGNEFPNLGCDVVSVCLPEFIQSALAACPEIALSNEGKQARRRLEELLPRVRFGAPSPDEQADHDAAIDALDDLSEACPA